MYQTILEVVLQVVAHLLLVPVVVVLENVLVVVEVVNTGLTQVCILVLAAEHRLIVVLVVALDGVEFVMEEEGFK